MNKIARMAKLDLLVQETPKKCVIVS